MLQKNTHFNLNFNFEVKFQDLIIYQILNCLLKFSTNLKHSKTKNFNLYIYIYHSLQNPMFTVSSKQCSALKTIKQIENKLESKFKFFSTHFQIFVLLKSTKIFRVISRSHWNNNNNQFFDAMFSHENFQS